MLHACGTLVRRPEILVGLEDEKLRSESLVIGE